MGRGRFGWFVGVGTNDAGVAGLIWEAVGTNDGW